MNINAVGLFSQAQPANNFRPALVVEARLSDKGQVDMTGPDTDLILILNKEGILDSGSGKRLFPRNGKAFLLALLAERLGYFFPQRIA